eukprot:6316220-Prymnesium_polylepis.1
MGPSTWAGLSGYCFIVIVIIDCHECSHRRCGLGCPPRCRLARVCWVVPWWVEGRLRLARPEGTFREHAWAMAHSGGTDVGVGCP